MTRQAAVRAAQLEAETAAAAIAVYRFPAWKVDVYGVRAVDRLPADAQRFEVFGAARPAAGPAEAGQGTLF